MNRQQQLEQIADEIRACSLCRKGGSGRPVPGEGSASAAVMFVGEAPGREEAKTGRPFVGRSGKFLRAMMGEIGLDERQVFITSPVHYLPDAGKPSTAMIEHGAIHLRKQIEAIRPRVIVLLGKSAYRALLGTDRGTAEQEPRVIEHEGARILISCHPAYAMRFPEGRKKFTSDFARLRALLAGRETRGTTGGQDRT